MKLTVPFLLLSSVSFSQRFEMALGLPMGMAPTQVVMQPEQPSGIEIIANHQPGEILTAVALSRLKGVGLYNVSICNRSGSAQRELSGTDIRAALGRKLDLVAYSLTNATFKRSRERSKRYWIIRASEIGLLTLNVAIASDLVKVTTSIRGAAATALPVVDRLTHWLDNSGSTPEQIGPWIEPDNLYSLQPGRCVSGLVLGAWPARTPLTVELP